MFSPKALPLQLFHPPPLPGYPPLPAFCRPLPLVYPPPPRFLVVQPRPVWDHHFRRPPAHPRSLTTVQVWKTDLEDAFAIINNFLSNKRGGPKFVSMDTEFPGTYYPLTKPNGVPYHMIPPADFYSNMKQNVDALKLIQLGLTLSDAWEDVLFEFNFRDFDPDNDLHNQESISLLKKQGIDFLANKRDGIDSRDFARLFLKSRLASSSPHVVWVTFHGPYDFAYLIKILIGNLPLPDNLKIFMEKVKGYFGQRVYDPKTMISHVGLHGGLDRVARSLNLDRSAGKSHQAGSDSLLTMHVFFRLMNNCDPKYWHNIMVNSNYKLYGLTTQ